MRDMHPDELIAGHPWQEATLKYHDGAQRKVLCIDVEIPFPEGKLIVSRTDPQGRIVHANQAFIEMSGFTEPELMGQPHYLLRHPEMPAVAFGDLWQTVARGEKWHGYVKNLRKDGAYYWVYATVIPNMRKGELIGYTSVRRKPSRAQVDKHAALYAEMRAKELA